VTDPVYANTVIEYGVREDGRDVPLSLGYGTAGEGKAKTFITEQADPARWKICVRGVLLGDWGSYVIEREESA